MTSLLVMVPTRGRRALAERCLKTYADTVSLDSTDIAFIVDSDDQDTYEGVDWGPAACGVLDPREPTLSGILNKTASAVVGDYDVLMHVSDDCVFVTPGWDRMMLDLLAEMGGSGWVYPDDRRRHDVPEIWMTSSDVVRELGWFMPPQMGHFYVDNAVGELGKRSGLIRFCPAAVIEHKHYSVDPEAVHDATYREAEETFGAADHQAFLQWRADVMPYEVARLRRRFNKDLAWVIDRVGGHGLAAA